MNYDITKHPDKWKSFVDYTYKQIEELMTGYGPVDILWLHDLHVGDAVGDVGGHRRDLHRDGDEPDDHDEGDRSQDQRQAGSTTVLGHPATIPTCGRFHAAR